MAFDLRLVNKMFVLAKDNKDKWAVHQILGNRIWTLGVPSEKVGTLKNLKKFRYLRNCKSVSNKFKLDVGDVVYDTDEKGHRSVYYILSVIEQDDGNFETVIGQ